MHQAINHSTIIIENYNREGSHFKVQENSNVRLTFFLNIVKLNLFIQVFFVRI